MTVVQWGILSACLLTCVMIAGLVTVLVRFLRQQQHTASVSEGPHGPSDTADAARLDAKIAELRALLAEADARIAELRCLATGGPDALQRLSVALPPAQRDQILLLDTEGLDAVEIARRMEMDVCDVRLVLNLQRTQQQTP